MNVLKFCRNLTGIVVVSFISNQEGAETLVFFYGREKIQLNNFNNLFHLVKSDKEWIKNELWISYLFFLEDFGPLGSKKPELTAIACEKF